MPKYRIVWSSKEDDVEQKMNALAEVGYILASFNYVAGDNQDLNDVYHAVMKLDEGSYEGVTNLRDVSPELVDDALASGWEIASSSISTKFVRMIRRRKP